MEDGVSNVRKVARYAASHGLDLDDEVIAAFGRAFRALRKPREAFEFVKVVMKKQKIPPSSIFASALMGAQETGGDGGGDLEVEVLRLMSSVGYVWDRKRAADRAVRARIEASEKFDHADNSERKEARRMKLRRRLAIEEVKGPRAA